MTSREKGNFCELMAGLFSPPESETIGDLFRDLVPSMLNLKNDRHHEAEIPGHLAPGAEVPLSDLETEYERLFSGPGQCVSLIESSYKRWTMDPECRLSFAGEKGLLMGDSALHMTALFQGGGLEVSEEFRGCPDHLVLELEFLAALYRTAGDREIKRFINDHLDWIPELKRELTDSRPHAFYRSAVKALDFFLRGERERLEKVENG